MSAAGCKVTENIESSLDGGQNNIEVDAVLPATATTAQLNVMAETLERTIWLSHVDPLGRFGLIVRHQGDTDPVLQRLFRSSLDTPPLQVKYGPTPNGPPRLISFLLVVDAAAGGGSPRQTRVEVKPRVEVKTNCPPVGADVAGVMDCCGAHQVVDGPEGVLTDEPILIWRGQRPAADYESRGSVW